MAFSSVLSVNYPLDLIPLDLQDGPDIQRCGKGEDEAGEQDRRRGELKLTVLAV